MVEITERPQVDLLAFAGDLFHAEYILEEPQALVGFGGQELGMAQVSDVLYELSCLRHGAVLLLSGFSSGLLLGLQLGDAARSPPRAEVPMGLIGLLVVIILVIILLRLI